MNIKELEARINQLYIKIDSMSTKNRQIELSISDKRIKMFLSDVKALNKKTKNDYKLSSENPVHRVIIEAQALQDYKKNR